MPTMQPRSPQRAAQSNAGLPQEDDEPGMSPAQVAATPTPTGTTGGAIPQQGGEWWHAQAQPVQWSADPQQRTQQAMAETDRRLEAHFSELNPFTRTSFDKVATPASFYQHGVQQAHQEFQQQQVAQRQQTTDANAQFNSQALAKYKSSGQQYYTDPATKRLVPVVDQQGRSLFHPTDWEEAYSEKEGRQMLRKRNQFGQGIWKDIPVVPGLDPTDEQMYFKKSDGTLAPAGKIADMLGSSNYMVARAAHTANIRRIGAMHKAAIAPLAEDAAAASSASSAANTTHSEMVTRLKEAQAVIANNPDQESEEVLRAEATVNALNQHLPAVALKDRNLQNQAQRARQSLITAKAQGAHDLYQAQSDQILNRLKQQGIDPATDAGYQANLQGLQAVQRGAQQAGVSIAGVQPAAPTTAVTPQAVAAAQSPTPPPSAPVDIKKAWATSSPLDRLRMLFGSNGYGQTEVEGAVPILGSEASGTTGGLATIPKMDGTGKLAGVVNAANKFTSGLTTPENVGLMAATGGTGALARAGAGTALGAAAKGAEAISVAGFAGQGAVDTIAAAKEARRVLADPKATDAEKAEAITSLGLSSAMTGAAAHGAVEQARQVKSFGAKPAASAAKSIDKMTPAEAEVEYNRQVSAAGIATDAGAAEAVKRMEENSKGAVQAGLGIPEIKSAADSAAVLEPALAEKANTPPANKSASESAQVFAKDAQDTRTAAAAEEGVQALVDEVQQASGKSREEILATRKNADGSSKPIEQWAEELQKESEYQKSPLTVDPERRATELRADIAKQDVEWQKHLDQLAAESQMHAKLADSPDEAAALVQAAKDRHEGLTSRRDAIEKQLTEADRLRQSKAGGDALANDLREKAEASSLTPEEKAQFSALLKEGQPISEASGASAPTDVTPVPIGDRSGRPTGAAEEAIVAQMRKDAGLPPKEPELMTPDEFKASNLKRDAESYMADAVADKKPVNAQSAEDSGLQKQLAENGYIREGDRYIFKPKLEETQHAIPEQSPGPTDVRQASENGKGVGEQNPIDQGASGARQTAPESAPAVQGEVAAPKLDSLSESKLAALADQLGIKTMGASGDRLRARIESNAHPNDIAEALANPKQSVADKALSALDKRREELIKRSLGGGKLGANTGLKDAAEIAAIDLAKLGIKAGRTVAQVIQHAIAHFKARYKDWSQDDVDRIAKTIQDAHGVPPEPTTPKTSPKESGVSTKAGDTTGIAHRVSESRGMEAERGEGISAKDSVEKGRKLLKDGYDIENGFKEFDKTKAVSADLIAAARANLENLSKASNKAADEHGTDSPEYKAAWDAEKKAIDQIKPLQTEWHKQGQAQQGETEIDTGTFHGIAKAFRESTGKDMNEGQAKVAKKISNGVKKATDEVASAQDKLIKSVDSGTKATAGSIKTATDVVNKREAGKPWTPEEAKALWHLAKANYLDKGKNDFNDIRAGLAEDHGMTKKEIAAGLASPKGAAAMTDAMYAKMSERRRVVDLAKQWIADAKYPGWLNAARNVPKFFFNLATFGHGTVGMITHAGNQMFNPTAVKDYWNNFGKQFPLMLSGAYHERAMQDLVRDPNFIKAKRAGLANDPFKYQDDYQNAAVVEQFKRIGLAGNRGFDALKLFRQDRFNRNWENLPKELQTPEMAKLVAQNINHATGVVTNSRKFSIGNAPSWLLFAPKLEASRWATLIGEPAKAAKTFANWKEETPEARHAAVNEVKQKAAIAATYFGALAINQGLLSASGSDQKVNFTNPRKGDWLSFKAGGHNVGVVSPMIGSVRFLANVMHDMTGERSKFESMQGSRAEETYKDVGQYVRGKESPFAKVVTDIETQADFRDKPMPFSKDPVSFRAKAQGVKAPYTYAEYAAKNFTPIPVQEYVAEVWKDAGMSNAQIQDHLRALALAGVVGATGARINEDTSGEYKPKRAK